MTRDHDDRFSRRTFLQVSTVGAAAAGLSLACSNGQSSAPEIDAGAPPEGGVAPSDAAGGSETATGADTGAGAAALVGLARAASVGDAVRNAVALTSGLGFVRGGDTVLLKPNLNSGDPSPFSTNPEIVRAVVEMLKDLGAGRIIIADRSNPSYDTMDAMARSGIQAVGTELEVEMMDLDGLPTRRLTPAQATHWANGYNMYTLVLDDVDHVINLCCCKHHSMANFTMALKAWMGIVVQGDRTTAHSDLGNRLPELHLGRRESFVIMDATSVVLTRGPNPGGATASPGLVVASADPVANDVTGLAILKHALEQNNVSSPAIADGTVWQQSQIARGLQLGLGITAPEQYNARASGVSELDALMAFIRT